MLCKHLQLWAKPPLGGYFIVACLPNSYVFSNENITSSRKTDLGCESHQIFPDFLNRRFWINSFEEPPESRGISFQRQQFSLQFTPWCCKHELIFNDVIFFVCPSLCVEKCCLFKTTKTWHCLNLNQITNVEVFERTVPKECIFWVHKHSWPTRPTKRATHEAQRGCRGVPLVGLRREMPYLCTGVPFQDTMILIISDYILACCESNICLPQPTNLLFLKS